MKWTLTDVAAMCSGAAAGDATVTSVAIDSRAVTPGALFVAVRGERDDGHRYLDDAMNAGAVGVVVETGRRRNHPGVEVEDTLVALRRMAAARRLELGCPVIAVTGSSGKTTTKDLIGSVMGEGSFASPKSFNNEFGVPLTVLAAPDDCEVLVVEVGSRGIGHIALLAEAIRPTVAVITNIGRAHLEMFGDLAGVATAKYELIEALEPGGTAVLPATETALIDRTDGTVITFGGDGADVAAREVELDESGRATFTLSYADQSLKLKLPIPGGHQPFNAAAAVAGAVAAGCDFNDAAGRLAQVEISPWRMELGSIAVGEGRATVVNDAYNANPDSMTAALETVGAMPGRHIAVLGKMFELGQYEAAAHREVGAHAAALGFEVIVVGDDPGLAAGAGDAATVVPDAADAVDLVRGMIAPGDVLLVKASRAAGLETIAATLRGDQS
jgi:UDP-N-acetylmuramoyl-tripeptide--D-alanyl-D-alanine ligase